MLSAMTTSENFPTPHQSGCSLLPYNTVIEPSYVSSLLRHTPQKDSGDEEEIFKRRLIQNGKVDEKITPCIRYFCTESKKKDLFDFSEERGSASVSDIISMEVHKAELENELIDLLEQLEVDDMIYEQSKPLKIDPQVLKLDFSKLYVKKDFDSLDNLCSTNFSECKRASHHLSGGGLLTDTTQTEFHNSEENSPKIHTCKSSEDSVSNKNVFNFENLVDLTGGVANFLNQISPSSPLTFDLTAHNVQEKNTTTTGISYEAESTNPFKSNLDNDCSLSPTNPFSDFCCSSSHQEIPSINCIAPKYENITLPEKSFSQCSTRPASPVLKISEEPFVLNPFLINKTSLESNSSKDTQFYESEAKLQNSAVCLPNPSSFIFAVPVFPIFQNNITNSSTQTGDLVDTPNPKEPVYQNVTNQLRKFMKRNDHSEYDLQCLKTTLKDLRNSGWYYENVSWQESVVLLTDTEPGTFLIRDSSDPNFLFSLSVQTSRGPTSVRLHYVNGQFRLDAEKKLIPHMPSFNSVIELIDYYVENTVKNKSNNELNKSAKKPGKHKLQKSKDQVWIDSQGNVYSNILLVKPLYKRNYFSTLQHLTRLTINKCIKKRLNAKVKFNFRVTPVYEASPFQDSSFQNNFDNFCPVLSIDSLPLPKTLLEFLKEYPYSH